MSRKPSDIHAEAMERLGEGMDAEYENDREALDDLRNLIGRQWPDDIRQAREAAGRPCLTVNRLPQFVRQVTGDIRKMNPAITITPSDDAATDEVATLYEGLIRQIQYASDAPSIYEMAGESAASCGKGAYRVLADYCDDDTFDQEIRIAGIRDPFAVVWDPAAVLPTREDAEWVFVKSRMDDEAFKAAYPDASPVPVKDDGATLHWRDGDQIVIAEYFWKEPVDKTIWQLPSGQVVGKVPPGITASRSRQVRAHKVMWAKVTGAEILEGPKEFPSKYLPVIAVMGEEISVGGDTYRSGVIRFAKDSQRMYNYWRSAHTELVALQPKAPYLVTARQIAGREAEWQDANNSNAAVLVYTPDEKAVAPMRQAPPVQSAGMGQETMLAAEDMKATTGIYDAGLGNRSNEHSGVAIRQRQMESDVATSIYSDNIGKSVAHCGRIIVDMIPKIYDTQRVLQIVGQDNTAQRVMVNQPQMTADGEIVRNNMSAGKYGVRVSVGPNYSTLRQQTAESMVEFIRAVPAAGTVTADLVAKYQDWPHADEFAERLKTLLPPGTAQGDQPDPQAMMQQQAAMQQQQQAQQMAQRMAMLQLQEQDAKARKAVADADKAEAEAEAFKAHTAGQMAAKAAVADQFQPGYPA